MTRESPFVSFLVPAYNAAPYLTALCESLRAQTFQNFEALILNDGSTDNTSEILAPFRKDTRFQIIEWRINRGVSAATLHLLSRHRGDYWCHPGADDILHPDFLLRRLELIEENPQAVMVHGPPQLINHLGQEVKDCCPLRLPATMGGSRSLSVLLQHNIINTPSVCVRSAITRLLLPYFETTWCYAQDWYLWILHAATGFDMMWDPQPLHQYRVHPNSLTTQPALNPVRNAEIRLVPLCALSVASNFSNQATGLWLQRRKSLYALWLRRAFRLSRLGLLKTSWFERAAFLFHGSDCTRRGLTTELALYALPLALASFREVAARRRQSFQVAGLAEIDDPIFREAAWRGE